MFVQIGKHARRAITFTIVAMMMFGSLAMPTSTLAQSQTLQSSLTGVTIGYQAPYQLFEDGRYADDAMETMMFVGPADILAMGFMSPLIDINGARDIMLEALFGEMGNASTIDRGDYTGVSYSLDMLNIDGQEMGVFSLFMNQRSHGYAEFYIFLAPPTLFGNSMQTAQNSFTIDGNPLMDGVDAMAMGNMVTSNIGITGGEAVTDVTDVAEPDDAGTDTTQTDTTQSGDTTSTEGEDLTYLLDVLVEYSAVDSSIVAILETMQQMSNDEITAQEARVVLDEESAYLAGVNDRVAQIQVPAGMQDFHQETLHWADSVTAIGTTWIDLVEGRGDETATANALQNGVDVHIEYGDKLQAQQISVGDSQESTDTGDTTETTTATEVAQPDSGGGDATAYVETIQDHRLEFVMSLGSFNDSLSTLEGDPTDADVQAAFDGTLTEAEYWAGFSANAQQLTPPPGYEGVHDAYLEWAGHVTELGNIWIAALNGDTTQIDVFFDYLPTVQQADDDLQAAITAANEQNSGSTSTTGDNDTADTGGTTTRTTRSSGSSGDDQPDSGEATETTSRTSRSGSLATDEDDDSGNTSETSGRTSRGSTDASAPELPNEWVAEANGVSITWSDDFALSELASDPQVSDASAGEDSLYLQANTPEGDAVPLSVVVMENPGNDSTLLIATLVDEPASAEDVWGVGTEIHEYNITDSASAVLMRAEDEIGKYWVYVQVTCLDSACGTVVVLEIGTEGYPMVDTLSLAEGGLAVEGVTVSVAIPTSDVERVVETIGN